MKQKITDFIYSHREEIIDTIRQLVEIPSVKGEPKSGAPFGEEPKRALYRMLEICRSMGFATCCSNNVVGTADYCPEGEIGLGILGHLDVVPAEPLNWSFPPFELTRKDGLLYGRGVIDDKGPCVAALYALYCVKELGIPLKRGVRLLFGTDEENGSGDLEIYRRRNTLPPMVFTPDAAFPLINIEKGMIRADIVGEYEEGSVISFCGGSIPNAVADKATAVVRGIDFDDVREAIAANGTGAVITAEQLSDGGVTLHSTGRSAHASTPETGVNAVTALLETLGRMPLKQGSQSDIIRGLCAKFPCGETDGRSAGLAVTDEKSGALTLVLSKFGMQDGKISGCIDIRFPVCTEVSSVVSGLSAALEAAGVRYGKNIEEEPHIVPEDSELVQKLLKAYSDIEGEPGHCIAIGGGTYVHDIDGGVAFGVERGDTDYHMHGNDEFIGEEELLRDAVMFAYAIAELCG